MMRILVVLALCSMELALISAKDGAVLSYIDTENYIYCGGQLEKLLEEASTSSGFTVIQMPPALPYQTEVETDLTLLQMHELSDRQVFSATAMITFRWQDKRLAINDSTCWNSSAQFTVITARSLVWYPQWTISNGHGTVLLEEAWQFNPAIVYADGHVTWKVSFDFSTECPMDVEVFPFDVQQCSIDITSPFYDTTTLKFKASSAITAAREASLLSPVWRIIGQQATQVTSQFPSISFRLLIQRRPGFYTVALILPIVVVNIITAYTFLLPAYQDEKTSTAQAAVISYFFILIMFFDYVPANSDRIPALIIFLTFHSFMGVIAYLVECRLIKFAEDKKHEESQASLRQAGLTLKNNKIVPLDMAKEEKKKGPFDGLSAEYVNDWCLIAYLVGIVLCYIIFFIYVPIKAQATRDNLLATTYAAVPIE